jgi:pimeloyl-ACP methyl ester carboxylesterase
LLRYSAGSSWPLVGAPNDQTFDSHGVRIHYVEEGRGEPVILIHGFTSSVERQWMNTGVFSALAKRYRVIAFDNRGHGKSGKPHDPKQYGREMGQDAIRLMDFLRIQRAHLVGYSMGSAIAAQLLALHPERLTTLTVGGAPGRFAWTAEDARPAESEAAEYESGNLRPLALRLWPTNAHPPQKNNSSNGRRRGKQLRTSWPWPPYAVVGATS